MPGKQRVQIEELGRAEAEAILARNNVGRIAYSVHDRVNIEPINYVFSEGSIYCRTSAGAKLTAIQHNYWVAFEVDEVEAVFRWRSVIVHGGFYPLPAAGSERTEGAWEHGIELLRRIIPETMTPEDPVPHRWFLFRIAVQEITGRSCTTSLE